MTLRSSLFILVLLGTCQHLAAGEQDSLFWRLQASKFEPLETKESLYQEFIEKFPGHTQVHWQFAEELEREHRYNEALAQYATHVEVNQAAGNALDKEAYLKLWNLLLKQGRTSDAKNYLEMFVEGHSDDKASLAGKLEDFDLSGLQDPLFAGFVAKIEALGNYNNKRKLNQALAMLESGQPGEAMGMFGRHVEINPYNLDLYVDFYIALDKARQKKMAAEVREMIWQSPATDAEKCSAIHRIETECRL